MRDAGRVPGTASAEPILSLTQVSKSFSGIPVVQGLSLEVPRGSTTALIGPSGCGKSTLLRLMNGLSVPDSGSVCFDGAPLHPARLLDVRRRIGYVIQDGGLFPHLSAQDNVTLMATHLGWDPARRRARVAEMAEMVRLLPDSLQRYPGELSGGQRQRVALMRALMLDPALLLLDEPLGALDPIIRYDLQTELRALFRALGKSVVMVSHDLGEAGWFGDTVVLVEAGRVAQRGTMEDMVRAPASAFVERFVKAQRGHRELV